MTKKARVLIFSLHRKKVGRLFSFLFSHIDSRKAVCNITGTFFPEVKAKFLENFLNHLSIFVVKILGIQSSPVQSCIGIQLLSVPVTRPGI